MLLLKEYKNNSLMAILCGIMLLFLSAIMPVFNFSQLYIVKFYEIIVSMIASIYCAYLLYNGSDLEICLTSHISAFRFFITKYIAFFTLILAMGAIQYAICSVIFNPVFGYYVLMGLVPATLVLSSLAFLVTLFFKNTSSGLIVVLILVIFENWIGEHLNKHLIPRYYYEFISLYDTTYMCGRSDLWLTNRFIMLGMTLFFWILIFLLIKKRKRELFN